MSRPTVLELLQQRRASGSRPCERDDPWTVWLVLESGGQAGVILGGFVSALEALGYKDCFDGVVGSSAGSMTGAYFATGQAALGTTIYPEDNCDGRFLSLWRLFTSKPLMDLDYLVDEVMTKVKPLDVEALKASPIPVWAVATHAKGARRLLPLHGVDADHLKANMKASARVPIWASRRLRGHRLWDGSLCEPVPVDSAVACGASHVLVLGRHSNINELFQRSLGRRVVEDFFLNQTPSLKNILRIRKMPCYKNLSILRVSIPSCIGVTCCNSRLLWKAAIEAYDCMARMLEGEDKLPLVWTTYFNVRGVETGR